MESRPASFGEKDLQVCLQPDGTQASSLSKHSAPPFCWAELIFPNACDIDTVLTAMSKDWKRLLALEQSVPAGAQELAEFLRLCLDPPSRIMVQPFESYSFQMAEGPFVILRQLFGNMPDAKLVEDAHQRVRVSQKKQPNKSLTMGQIQQVVNDCDVWESRGAEVLGKVSKDFFCSKWRRTSDKFKTRKLCSPRGHRLPKHFCKIMSDKSGKDWPSLSETNLTKAIAGRHWLRIYTEKKLNRSGALLQVLCIKIVCS